ncbi:MAG: hypothetical protein AAF434_01540 [Pseudomonadota bacterium]
MELSQLNPHTAPSGQKRDKQPSLFSEFVHSFAPQATRLRSSLAFAQCRDIVALFLVVLDGSVKTRLRSMGNLQTFSQSKLFALGRFALTRTTCATCGGLGRRLRRRPICRRYGARRLK